MPEKLSDYVMRFVAEAGVRDVFMLPGGGAMHLNDSLGKNPNLRYVCNLHEQASAIAAEAYSRVTNGLGCAMVTTGPGGTNAVTGVAAAYLDSTPVLFLSGQVKRPDLKGESGVRILGAQEIDIVSIVTPITKYAVTVLDPKSIRFNLEKGLYLAMHGRRGPVWIDVPMDVQAAQIEPDQLPGFDPAESTEATWDRDALPVKIDEVLGLLARSERPILLVGNGIRSAGAADEFVAFAEHLGIPVLTTWLGLDLIPDAHPLFVGRPGAIAPRGANFALQNSDLLIVLGARMDMALTAYAHDKLARAATKVMVDIDPAEIRKMKCPIQVPIIADAAAFLRSVRARKLPVETPARAAWRRRCLDWKDRYPVVQPSHRTMDKPLSMYHFAEVLWDELADNDLIVPSSSGFASEIFFLCARVKSRQRVFHNRGTGAMGFAIPATIGACVAASGKRTVSVDGDGGFQMNVQELATVARLGHPIKLFVVNNDGYASIRASQANYFGRLVAADRTSGMTLPELRKVAEAFNIPFARVDAIADLRSTIRGVLASPGPTVCEVVTAPDEPRGPRVASAQRADGTMVSKPLEDLWPFLDRDEFRGNMLIPTLDE